MSKRSAPKNSGRSKNSPGRSAQKTGPADDGAEPFRMAQVQPFNTVRRRVGDKVRDTY